MTTMDKIQDPYPMPPALPCEDDSDPPLEIIFIQELEQGTTPSALDQPDTRADTDNEHQHDSHIIRDGCRNDCQCHMAS